MQKQELISQCAESKVYAADFCGTPAVLKHRFAKTYRHPILDQRLREQRTQREARALTRCRKFEVPAPTLFSVDKTDCTILMERIIGKTVRDVINITHAEEVHPNNRARSSSLPASPRGASTASNTSQGPFTPTHSSEMQRTLSGGGGGGVSATPGPGVGGVNCNIPAGPIVEKLARELLTQMGSLIGHLHNGDIIHGDLTTSNFMVRDIDRSVVVIDFGLVKDSTNAEERAVDLYVLERAVISAHPYLSNVPEAILTGYRMSVDGAKALTTVARLEAVRARGRKRSMVG